VEAVGPDDVWAVGRSRQPTFETNGITVTQHWNGRAWSEVPSPNQRFRRAESSQSLLSGVAAVSSDEVWAVGSAFGYSKSIARSFGPRMLALRWNGSRWRITANPDARRIRNSSLSSVDALPDGHVWAVGSASGRFRQRTLITARC
jgi:hypothetical protein